MRRIPLGSMPRTRSASTSEEVTRAAQGVAADRRLLLRGLGGRSGCRRRGRRGGGPSGGAAGGRLGLAGVRLLLRLRLERSADLRQAFDPPTFLPTTRLLHGGDALHAGPDVALATAGLGGLQTAVNRHDGIARTKRGEDPSGGPAAYPELASRARACSRAGHVERLRPPGRLRLLLAPQRRERLVRHGGRQPAHEV